MQETINELARRMVAKDGNLRIAFHEADQSRASEPEAAHFLKFKEKRFGRDLELYNFLAKVGSDQETTVTLLEELVLPIQGISPAAYVEGLDYLRSQGSIFGGKKQDWEQMIDSFKPTGP